MYKGVANSPETFLKENLVQGATIMYVADGSVFGTLPTLAVIGDDESAETVLVESFDNGAYTIRRAFEGAAKDWTKGATVARNFTNYDYQAVIDNITELGGRKIPSKLSELTDDSTHRLVTDAQRKAWDGKVDKVIGKDLSANDYTDKDKTTVNVDLPREIQALGTMLGQKADEKDIKTKLSEMIDDSTHRLVTDAEKAKWNALTENLSVIASNPDANGKYKTVEYKRKDGTLLFKTELIGTAPKYSQVKLTTYENGSVKSTQVWSLTYDANDFVYRKELQ